MKRKSFMLYIATGILVTVFFSCEHKELCYHHPHTTTIKVEFDWLDAPDATPAGMCVFFYPMEGEEASMRRFDFQSKTGGSIDIQVGKYRIICYNNDTEAVLLSGTESFYTHEAFTREGSLFESVYGSSAGAAASLQEDSVNERVVISPDMLWGCTALDVEITETGISYTSIPDNVSTVTTDRVITLYPHELICTYTYEIRHVNGLKYVSQMCGSLSGMAPSLLFSDESLGQERITIPFEAEADGDSTIVGQFLTFGNHEENTGPHRMKLYVWMNDGSKYYYGSNSERFNVTEQILSASDKRHVHIVIDSLDLPQPIVDDNIDASVDDWHEIDEDIHL